MIEHLKIQNYRLFESIEMQDLGRINILSGQNNSGKSSLIECLFLLGWAGNPNVLMADEIVRHISFDKSRIGVTMDVLWKSLFHRLATTRVFSIEASDTVHGNLSLEGSLKLADQFSLRVNRRRKALHRAFARDRAIVLTYCHNDVQFSNSIHEGQGALN